jgi:hypothetical protein
MQVVSSYDEFGFALAASGSTALIGAPGACDNASFEKCREPVPAHRPL